jgi:hypothetical protein
MRHFHRSQGHDGESAKTDVMSRRDIHHFHPATFDSDICIEVKGGKGRITEKPNVGVDE